MRDDGVLLLNHDDIVGVLDLPSTIRRTEAELLAAGRNGASTSFREHLEMPGGGFHVVGGSSELPRPALLVVKVNRRFDSSADGRPRGFLAVADAQTGQPLALMDSAEITKVRTAAQTAIAARLLAQEDADSLLVVGSGQLTSRIVEGVQLVRPLRQVEVWSRNHQHARTAAARVSSQLDVQARAVAELPAAARNAAMIVTITAARTPLLTFGDICPGTFVAALGSDGPGKQELDPRLLASASVVVDSVDQAIAHGELGHAVREGVMTPTDLHAELADVVSGRRPARTSGDETFVFDSTGTALQDVAAAAVVLDRVATTGVGTRASLDSARRSG